MRSSVSRIAVCAFGLALFAAPAGAAEFGEWDANADASLTSDEFRSGFEQTGVFNEWDSDDDLNLTESEFESGIGDNAQAFNGRFGEDAFGEWDANDDDMLSNDEFSDGVYASYDSDSSRVIEEPEFGDLGDDMGDGGLFDI
jgi:hypothetical protein